MIQLLGRMRQKDHKFKASLGNGMSSRPELPIFETSKEKDEKEAGAQLSVELSLRMRDTLS